MGWVGSHGSLLHQHSRCRDQRHLVLLAWMVLGLLLRGKLAAACSALAPHWQEPGERLLLALDTTMLWNRHCVVIVSIVVHGRAIPVLLLWQALEHTSASASISAEIYLALLKSSLQSGMEWHAGSRAHRSLVVSSSDCRSGVKHAELCGQPGWPAPAHGPPLAAGHELCENGRPVVPRGSGERGSNLVGLDPNPTEESGALRSQSQNGMTEKRDLVNAN
jgi:hypothetical protein